MIYSILSIISYLSPEGAFLVDLRRFVCVFISLRGNKNKGVAAVQPATINSPLDC